MLIKSLFTEEERKMLAQECCQPLRKLSKEEIEQSETTKEKAIQENIERLRELNPMAMKRIVSNNNVINCSDNVIDCNKLLKSRGSEAAFLEENENVLDIENRDLAAQDFFNGWVCHHKLETRGFGYTRKELKALGLYYNRPASEFIYLKTKEHAQLHVDYKRKAEEIRDQLTKCLY